MYSEQEQAVPANHEYAEALQPRISYEKPASSSNSKSNTAINDMNTACSISATGRDVIDGFHNSTNASTNTATASSSTTITNDTHKPTSGGFASDAGVLTAGFQAAAANGAGENLTSNSSPRLTEPACVESAGGCKRKRDWMNSFSDQTDKMENGGGGTYNLYGKSAGAGGKSSSSSLLTSVKISNGLYSFPAGWEQYLDLQTGETYYVNWNTRTKHCRAQCPEVQRCLAGVQQQQQRPYLNRSTPSNANKESVESWLSKMTAATSALVNNKPPFVSKPPLPPPSYCSSRPSPFKSCSTTKLQPSLELGIKSLAHPSSNHSTLTSLLDANHDTFATPLPTTLTPTHDTQSPSPMFRDFTCFSPSNEMTIPFSISPKPYNNLASFESATNINLDVASTSNIDPLAFMCSNCNNLVIISSLTSLQCPNCSHSITKWSEDITSSACDMPLSALPLLETTRSSN